MTPAYPLYAMRLVASILSSLVLLAITSRLLGSERNVAIFLTVDSLSVPTTNVKSRTSYNEGKTVAPPPSPASDDVHICPRSGADIKAWRNGYTNCLQTFSPTLIDCPNLPLDFPRGTYFRNGHGRFSSDDGVTTPHMFDGDGLMNAVTFDSSHSQILFRNKFIDTYGYRRDVATGKMTQRGIFGTMRSGGILANMFRLNYKNVANTNAIYAPTVNKLYALWEGGRPYVLDPLTLENDYVASPHGVDLHGLLRSHNKEFSAHPRYDPRTNTYCNFGNSLDPISGKTTVRLYELDADTFEPTKDTIEHEVSFQFNGVGLLHDFAVTENWYIFALNAAKIDFIGGLKAALGLTAFTSAMKFDENPTMTPFVLIPRREILIQRGQIGTASKMEIATDARVQVVESPFHFNFHFANAYEEEKTGEIVLDSVETAETNIGMDLITRAKGMGLWQLEPNVMNEIFPSKLVRYRLDPISKKSLWCPPVVVEGRYAVEFPVVPKSLSTRKARFIYTVGAHQPLVRLQETLSNDTERGTGPPGSFLKIDSTNPENTETYSFESHEFVGEAVFVPKVGAHVTNANQEDRGYLVSFVVNGRDKATELVIFDVEGPRALERGPISRTKVPAFIPFGLHGTFAEDCH